MAGLNLNYEEKYIMEHVENLKDRMLNVEKENKELKIEIEKLNIINRRD